jgi:(1->4)-alpha-D-glucan 1-alpha-D-glucosylmutase
MTPRATYRLQFNAEFTFADGARIAPYLARLGVSHVYASPILSSRTGSSHGYDGVDPTGVDLEIGGEEGLRAMVAELRSHGLGLIADIVPNHMAVGGADNAWWLDVLENGEASPYAGFFDIDWQSRDERLTGKVLAPFLGAPYGETLEAGEITLVFDEALESFAAAYHHHRFPIRPQDYPEILRAGGEDFAALVERFEEAQDRPSFIAACRVLASMGERLQQPLAAYADPDSLHALLEQQHFRLAWWRVAGDEINWRRFFDITELAGLRVEDPAVFALVHGTTLRLYREGLIDGVRIDHVDGLRDPAGYCRTLRERLAELEPLRPDTAPAGPAYLIVEKILGADERLPGDWRVDGTTGYDFMNTVSGLQHDAEAEDALGDLWSEVSGRYPDFESEELDARNELLVRDFAGQLDACARAFHRLANESIETRDITLRSAAPRHHHADRFVSGISHLRYHRRRAGLRRHHSCAGGRWSARTERAGRRARHRFRRGLARRSQHRGCGVARGSGRAVPAAFGPDRGEGRRGYGVLSLWPPALAQRCGLRRRAFRLFPRGVSRRRGGARAGFPGGDARYRDARSQAR